jgi:prepilin peptidase CpaA
MPLGALYILPLALCAAVSDLRSGKVSNLLVLAGLAAGLILAVTGCARGRVICSAAAGFGMNSGMAESGNGAAVPLTFLLETAEAVPLRDRLISFAAGAAVPFALGFPLFHFRVMGAGDIKLLMAIGSIAGSAVILPFLAACIFCGGGIALLLLPGYIRAYRFHFTVPILMTSILYAGGLVV